jgi:hypothetical protein
LSVKQVQDRYYTSAALPHTTNSLDPKGSSMLSCIVLPIPGSRLFYKLTPLSLLYLSCGPQNSHQY